MKVSLIQPKMQRRPVDTSLKARMSPHLGLLTIAGLVRRAGHEVSVQNGNLKPVEIPDDADLVGITVTVDVLPQAIELAKLCREKRIPVVAGGIGVASDPDTARPHFDAICIGPAEGHWPQLLADVQRGTLKREYVTGADLKGEALAAPDFRYADPAQCLYGNVIAASRGCPFACDFCYNSAPGMRGHYLHRTVESVIDEIRSKGVRHVMFIDDNFIGDIAFARALMEAMRPLRLKWNAAVSANIVDHPDLLDIMRETGCQSLFVGFESINAGSLACVHKRQNDIVRYERLVEMLHNRGIMINASFVFGLDSDGPSVFKDTLEWIVRNRIETVTSHILTPYPGTALYERMKVEGRLTDDNLSNYDTAHVVFKPKCMTAQELYDGYLWIYREVYSLKNILRRTPKSLSQVVPYYLFNLFYRKYGRFTERLGDRIGFDRVGAWARRLSYWR